jgi:hypothetical protein
MQDIFASQYDSDIVRERNAWYSLHQLKRDDPGYPIALAEWRAAADGLSALTLKVLEKKSTARALER